jgi:small-conductance mechanosensitive channel
MNQFTVPQFIDVEDKIFGPITVRQFLILIVAGLILFMVFRFADTALFVLCSIVIGGFALVLAFVKINGQAFHYFLLNVVQTIRKPKLRIWDKRYTRQELLEFAKPQEKIEREVVEIKTASARHIRDLSLLVNTGGYYKPE